MPDHLLAKSGPLTPEEFARVCRYPEIGAEIVSAVPFPYPVAPFIRHHHERWDGTGYPDMIAGDLIPLGARIIAIAERFDALRSERPYRPPLSPGEAVAHIRHEAGTSLDPHLVAKFIEILPAIEAKAGDDDRRDPVLDNISEAQGELYELLERARAESHTDALTDLPNRRFVETHMARELARAQRAGSGLAVLAIDLNDFKIINDRLGHGAGDIVLKAVAQCLRRGLRPHDICGRHGGDEFVVVLSGAASEIADLQERRAGARLSTASPSTWEAARPCASASASAPPSIPPTASRSTICSPPPTCGCTRTSSACASERRLWSLGHLVIWSSFDHFQNGSTRQR